MTPNLFGAISARDLFIPFYTLYNIFERFPFYYELRFWFSFSHIFVEAMLNRVFSIFFDLLVLWIYAYMFSLTRVCMSAVMCMCLER